MVCLCQFGVSAGVLNCELPLSSRWHAIEAFNRGAFDILIATDDPKLMTGRATDGKPVTSHPSSLLEIPWGLGCHWIANKN